IKINHKNAFATLRQQAAQRDHRCGFTHATFLIGYCPDSHVFSPENTLLQPAKSRYIRLIGQQLNNLNVNGALTHNAPNAGLPRDQQHHTPIAPAPLLGVVPRQRLMLPIAHRGHAIGLNAVHTQHAHNRRRTGR
ncbi:hypothetical protein LCGC14_1971000, partial [marine sediment metagenome]